MEAIDHEAETLLTKKTHHHKICPAVVGKNFIRLPCDRDVGPYLFGLRDLENPGSQLGWQKMPLSLTDLVPS